MAAVLWNVQCRSQSLLPRSRESMVSVPATTVGCGPDRDSTRLHSTSTVRRKRVPLSIRPDYWILSVLPGSQLVQYRGRPLGERVGVGSEEARDGLLADRAAVVDGSGRRVRGLERPARGPAHRRPLLVGGGFVRAVDLDDGCVEGRERGLDGLVERAVRREREVGVVFAGR